jgi:predicted nucleic acid-binding protein
MNKILIDTNIYSSALRGDPAVVQVLRQVVLIGICAVSIGELLSGFRGGNKEQENRRELGVFLDSPRVVLYSVDEYTAEYYCSILNQLKKRGTPIPTNDIWIAAAALQHGL